MWENKRRYTKTQLIEKLHDSFEVEKVILIPWDKECEFGHSDGMLRFISSNTVLISAVYEQMNDKFKIKLLKSIEQAGLNWEWLRCSSKEVDTNIAYINFLQTKDIILMPKLNREEDKTALIEISRFYPDYKEKDAIHQIEVDEIARHGGALNCISWTIKV